MHAILVTMGTDGDVFPFLALGSALNMRGHRITLVANQRYKTLAADHGFAFHTLISDSEDDRLFSNPDFWRPFKGPLLGARVSAPLIGKQCTLLAELVGGKDAVLVASAGVFAAAIVRERFSIPTATIVCQPWLIPSALAPPAMPGGLPLPRWAPRTVRRMFYAMIDAIGGTLVGKYINEARAVLGLGPVRGVFSWCFSPDLVIGLFPEWYAQQQPDWPAQVRLTGFPLYDGNPNGSLPADVATFCRESAPPVVFTFGSGMQHASESFRMAVETCQALNLRGICLTKHKAQLPTTLPVDVRHFPFVPLRSLLPCCSAIVHHGGIGTLSQAMAAMTPQLVLPLAWDQPDNACRVTRLGVGDWLPRHQQSTSFVIRCLRQLMTSNVRARCAEVARNFADVHPIQAAVALIEELENQRTFPKQRTSVTNPF